MACTISVQPTLDQACFSPTDDDIVVVSHVLEEGEGRPCRHGAGRYSTPRGAHVLEEGEGRPCRGPSPAADDRRRLFHQDAGDRQADGAHLRRSPCRRIHESAKLKSGCNGSPSTVCGSAGSSTRIIDRSRSSDSTAGAWRIAASTIAARGSSRPCCRNSAPVSTIFWSNRRPRGDDR